ncbi:hypothetical protein HK102_002849, partial [Quaeritorhiza haematococci]
MSTSSASSASAEFIRTIRPLQKLPKKDESLKILKTVASHVKPIMKSRGWRVGTLSEFFPSNANLLGLNVNHGAEIKLRLRPHYDQNVFLPFEDVVGTMLHELTHIVRGPHDAKFYAILDELTKEYESLLLSGYRGEGFEGPGYRVGQGVSHDDLLNPQLAKKRALEAAEKRRKIGELMLPSGGRRLGGGEKGVEKVYTPAQMAAMAAERRSRDDVTCGSGGLESADETTKMKTAGSSSSSSSSSSPSSKISKISKNDSRHGAAGKAGRASSIVSGSGGTANGASAVRIPEHYLPLAAKSIKPTNPKNLKGKNPIPAPTKSTNNNVILIDEDDEPLERVDSHPWTCPVCTLINRPLSLVCDCCLSERGVDKYERNVNGPGLVDLTSASPSPASTTMRTSNSNGGGKGKRKRGEDEEGEVGGGKIKEPACWSCPD